MWEKMSKIWTSLFLISKMRKMCSNSDDDEVNHSNKDNSLIENAMNAVNSNEINKNISPY